MWLRNSIAALGLTAALAVPAFADDYAKYPDLRGQWVGINADLNSPWDPSKPAGLGQQAPLTPEYQKIYDAKLAARKAGKIELTNCLSPGMPRTMVGYRPMEFAVLPQTTYVMATYMNEFRRIFTDGRKWPSDFEPSFSGYSIGQWVDENKDGRFVLSVETRGLKGPRIFDGTGLPLHKDDQSVVKERIYLDKADPNVLHDEVTTVDHALTKPWTVTRGYARSVRFGERNPAWNEFVCADENHQVQLGDEIYEISAQGLLAPTRPGQPAPDLKYFKQPTK